MSTKEQTEEIHLDLEDHEILELAMQAHEQRITLNQHIVNILTEVVKTYDAKSDEEE